MTSILTELKKLGQRYRREINVIVQVRATFYLCVILLAAVLIQPVEAKIYQIPDEILVEIATRKKQLEAMPTSNEAKFELAMAYAFAGRIEKGWGALKKIPKSYSPLIVKKYKHLSKTEPNEWRHPFKLAFGYFFQKKRAESVEQFKRVLEIDPKQIWAMGFIGLVEGDRKRNKEAIKWCKRALKIEPNAMAIHFLLAEGYRRTGNYFGAIGQMMIVGRLKTEESLAKIDEL